MQQNVCHHILFIIHMAGHTTHISSMTNASSWWLTNEDAYGSRRPTRQAGRHMYIHAACVVCSRQNIPHWSPPSLIQVKCLSPQQTSRHQAQPQYNISPFIVLCWAVTQPQITLQPSAMHEDCANCLHASWLPKISLCLRPLNFL